MTIYLRLIGSTTWMIFGASKFYYLFFSESPSPHSAYPLALLVAIGIAELLIGVGIATRYWREAVILSLLCLIGFLIATMAGFDDEHTPCGCFGAVNVGRESKLFIIIGLAILSFGLHFSNDNTRRRPAKES